MRREGGIKDEGTGKSMAKWNPAAIELFQLTLAEERGIPKHCLLARSLLLFDQNYTTFIAASHSSLASVSFSVFLYPEVACRFLFMKLRLVLLSPWNLFENVKPCTFCVFETFIRHSNMFKFALDLWKRAKYVSMTLYLSSLTCKHNAEMWLAKVQISKKIYGVSVSSHATNKKPYWVFSLSGETCKKQLLNLWSTTLRAQ